MNCMFYEQQQQPCKYISHLIPLILRLAFDLYFILTSVNIWTSPYTLSGRYIPMKEEFIAYWCMMYSQFIRRNWHCCCRNMYRTFKLSSVGVYWSTFSCYCTVGSTETFIHFLANCFLVLRHEQRRVSTINLHLKL